jgi:CheY-like chemotaxis protein
MTETSLEEEMTDQKMNPAQDCPTFSAASESGGETSGDSRPAQIGTHCILCVDDEIVGTRLRGDILEECGYSVALYHCPLAALECDFSKFDLAIFDFYMPGLNGRELFLRMRALGARFPIVLFAGCVDALSYEDRVLFARCIEKSTGTTYLLETIAEFLNPNQIPDFCA